MLFENPLRFVLRQAALELTAAIDAVVTVGAQLYHVRAINARAAHMLGRIGKRPEQTDGIQDFERAGLNRRRPGLTVRLEVALDEPCRHAVPGKLRRGKYARRTGADD
jgi:hypothetical protein